MYVLLKITEACGTHQRAVVDGWSLAEICLWMDRWALSVARSLVSREIDLEKWVTTLGLFCYMRELR